MKKASINLFLICLAALPGLTSAQNTVWSLKACIDTAIQRNISVQQGKLSSRISKINLQQAKDNVWPNLNITDAPEWNFGKTQNAVTGEYVNQNTTTNSFAVTSNANIFDGFLYLNTIKQNKFIYDASMQGIEKLKDDILLNTLADYLQVIAAYEEVDIAASQLASDSTGVIQAQKYVDAGKYPILNLLQMQSQMAADRLTKVNAEAQLKIAKVNLMQLMNLPVADNFDVERPIVDDNTLSVTALTPADIYKTAEGFLPEIKNAELNVNAEEMGIKLVQSEYLPRLSVTAGIRTSGSSIAYDQTYRQGTIGFLQGNLADPVTGYSQSVTISNSFSNLWTQLGNNFNEGIGLTLTIPIFNNFQARNNTDIARINVLNAKLNEDAVKITLRQNIEQAHVQLLTAAAQYYAAKQALETETLTYQNIQKKFEIGASTATDFLIEKSNYLKAEQSVIQTKYNYLFKGKLIDFYLGKPITM